MHNYIIMGYRLQGLFYKSGLELEDKAGEEAEDWAGEETEYKAGLRN